MMRTACALAGLLLWLVAGATASAAELAARDARTGAPVDAVLSYAEADGTTTSFALDGRLRPLDAPMQRVTATASAAGYHPLPFTLDPSTGSMTLLLEPLQAPPEFQQLERRAQAGDAWLQGYVRMDADGAPVAGAMVVVEGQQVLSDERGYFELAVPVRPADDFERSTLEVQAVGVGLQELAGLLLSAGVHRFVLALDGSASAGNEIGALDTDAERFSSIDAALDNLRSGHLPPRAPDAFGVMVAPGMAPPASIRVGFADAACTQACCTGSCGHTCTMALEEYVRRGLDNEWIASWNTQALRAGSVAYRSYGAWRVSTPASTNYDICSSACCQVNDGNTNSNTDAAIARTAGIMLTRDGSAVASSEYSAENNSWDDPNDGLACNNTDLSCGDGYAGSPALNWPCLSDPVGAGHGCFGHGRGMSQWGTQRWAIAGTPRLWPWIVDHYYNANGNGSGLRNAVMTSPLSLSGVAVQPSTVVPGTTIQIAAQARNLAGAEHPHLLIGASLYRSGTGYVDDSAHDTPLVLATGTHGIGRDFHVPAGTPAGSYDVLVSLYLDVDENDQITGTDLPLALVTAHGLLQVLDDDRIFADGFESP